jgi:phosphatidylinositol 4-kinase B
LNKTPKKIIRGDDLKQEQFALQLLSQIQQIFLQENLDLHLSLYSVISLDQNSGIIEYLKETLTIDALKQKLRQQNLPTDLLYFYRNYFKERL